METVYILPGIVILLIIIGIIINNGIISRKNMVVRSWADVITYERQKNETLPALEAQAKDYKEHEASLLTAVTELRSALAKASTQDVNTSDLAAIEASTTKLMSGFNIAVEAYPDLKQANVTMALMREISELQDNIAAGISIFNSNVEAFNTGVEIFPNSLVNSMFARQTPYRPFYNEAAASSLGFTPSQE
ncbi:LemA family protein [Kordiimonas pumila]|uniref:LemA family protein n=1 Tax=Kordiimonas pumila TaxID=2161677 RepID=A0ABV7D5L5_9PROT|nr:LemA family protein [Kordiimonas pumila]